MKAAIYNPYLDTLGGGERYTMAVAIALQKTGYKVFLQSSDKAITQKLTKRFGIDYSDIEVVKSIKRGSGYDICFWLSDGSVPTLAARKNILHFQRPFYDVDGKSLINKMKFFRINQVIANSQFTKLFIDKEFPKKSVVIYPPVDVESFKSRKKENLILSVGRFSQLEQSKRQDVLLRAFKKICDKEGIKDWELVLAGGSEVGRTNFVDKLKDKAKDYPVKIIESPDFKLIKDLYGRSKIFWTASGFGVDEKKFPEKVEHFGIAVVEAMSAGAVPVVYAAGGHKEIVGEKENGLLWKSTTTLAIKTKKLIGDNKLLKSLRAQAVKDSQQYSYERFEKEFLALL